jgi:hypothetical protein
MLGNRVRRITPTGLVSTFVGSGSTHSVDGTGVAALHWQPHWSSRGLVRGMCIITDNNFHKIRKSTPLGVVTTLAGSGSVGGTNGVGVAASFNPHWANSEL